MLNATIIYDIASGEPRMVVVDAANLSDPAWNPSGHAQLPIDPQIYQTTDLKISVSIVSEDGKSLLLGTLIQPITLADGTIISRGQIIRNAFVQSGLKSPDAFNALSDDDRSVIIKSVIATLPVQAVASI